MLVNLSQLEVWTRVPPPDYNCNLPSRFVLPIFLAQSVNTIQYNRVFHFSNIFKFENMQIIFPLYYPQILNHLRRWEAFPNLTYIFQQNWSQNTQEKILKSFFAFFRKNYVGNFCKSLNPVSYVGHSNFFQPLTYMAKSTSQAQYLKRKVFSLPDYALEISSDLYPISPLNPILTKS